MLHSALKLCYSIHKSESNSAHQNKGQWNCFSWCWVPFLIIAAMSDADQTVFIVTTPLSGRHAPTFVLILMAICEKSIIGVEYWANFCRSGDIVSTGTVYITSANVAELARVWENLLKIISKIITINSNIQFNTHSSVAVIWVNTISHANTASSNWVLPTSGKSFVV